MTTPNSLAKDSIDSLLHNHVDAVLGFSFLCEDNEYLSQPPVIPLDIFNINANTPFQRNENTNKT